LAEFVARPKKYRDRDLLYAGVKYAEKNHLKRDESTSPPSDKRRV
jgi:hypothetical protein